MNAVFRFCAAVSVFLFGAVGVTGQGFAQSYPTKTVELVVPFSAGSSPDVVARYLGSKLSDRLGQQFVVVNRGGAGGSLAADSVKRAPADGYTVFFMVNSIVTMNQFIYKQLSYDPATDFVPVSRVAKVPYVLIAHKDFPHKSLNDLISYAKANPGKVNYASAGVGGAGHVIMELMTSLAGVEFTHVPYGKGNPLLDVIAGQVPLIFQPTTTALEQIKRGTVFGLGITGERLPQLPDVPSISEVVPGYAADGWQGVIVRTGTPPAVIETLNREIAAVLALPETAETFARLGIQPSPTGVDEFAALIKSDTSKWGDVIRKAGIEAK
jgi:tripartite-type tricarboxylate transporter receptor subunit TctC